MRTPITRVTLFIPGVARAAGSRSFGDGIESTWIENDGSFADAFSYGTVSPDVLSRLAAAEGALILHFTTDLREGRATIIDAVATARAHGAIAVRIEQSKLGWEVGRWLDTFTADDPVAWYRGAVITLGTADGIQSCGMHAFSLPDVRIATGPTADEDARAIQTLATMLNVYQIAEDPVIVSGQTFAPDPDTPRRLLERWPDDGYAPDHACHNPYGVWHVGPPGGTARPLGELVPTFIPPLAAVLMAAERKAGAPLTKTQVEQIRDEAPCISMPRRDAQALERSRGYADLDPELAWEQWQVLRNA